MNVNYSDLELQVVAQMHKEAWDVHSFDLYCPKTLNGIRRGELVLLGARTSSKSLFEREFTMRMLKGRPKVVRPDMFWMDECDSRGLISFEDSKLWGWVLRGWDGKFRKMFSQEALDAPDLPKVEWTNFL